MSSNHRSAGVQGGATSQAPSFGVVLAAAVPPAVLLVLLVVMLAADAVGHSLIWFETPMTLPEAAALRDAAMVERLIRVDGADPDATGTVRPGILRSYGYRMTPLEAAVAARRIEIVTLLASLGARIDASNRPVLICFARDMGATDIDAHLSASGAVASCESVPKVRY